MTSSHSNTARRRADTFWAIWAVVAAFGTYFCMYGFRKPFTAAGFEDSWLLGVDFKTFAVSTQVIGYMLSKFIGIKVVSEMSPGRRAMALVGLILFAEAALAMFGILPRPFNMVGLFFNGLMLGMVYGLVIGFLEGRQLTEALVAGLCASFIVADGVTKSVGTWLLEVGISEDWMPFTAGLLFLLPLCLFTWMLSRIPPPTESDVESRCQRETMSSHQRRQLFFKYAPGLTLLVLVYLLITVMRSVRADFATELWQALNYEADPSTFTLSEILVAVGVLLVSGMSVYIKNNRSAFFLSLATCMGGFALLAIVLATQQAGAIPAFPFMVLVGFGLYVPYVTLHTTVFERLLAMTRERGNLGYLMYLADAFGYLGYVAVMFTRSYLTNQPNPLGFFIAFSWVALALSLLSLSATAFYFRQVEPAPVEVPAVEQGS